MSYPHPVSLGWRVLEAFFHMADKLCLPGVLVFLNGILKPGTRRLSGKEQGLAHTVFGATIDYETVRVDERAWIACKRYGIAYVSFNVINCWGALSDAHFIHEMVHIWQYQRHGAVYIPRALWAQRTPAGYNYGGVEALQQALAALEAEAGEGVGRQGAQGHGDDRSHRGYKQRVCHPSQEGVCLAGEQLLVVC